MDLASWVNYLKVLWVTAIRQDLCDIFDRRLSRSAACSGFGFDTNATRRGTIFKITKKKTLRISSGKPPRQGIVWGQYWAPRSALTSTKLKLGAYFKNSIFINCSANSKVRSNIKLQIWYSAISPVQPIYDHTLVSFLDKNQATGIFSQE